MILNGVVALYFFAGRSEGVGSVRYMLTFLGTADSHSQYILGIGAFQTRNLPGQLFRIRIAINLGLVVRGDNYFRSGNAQVAGFESHLVVTLVIRAIRRDGIRRIRHILARGTGKLIGNHIRSESSINRCCELGISVAVHLGLVFRGDGHRALVDGQFAGYRVHGELFGHIIAVAVRHLRGAGHIHIVCARVRFRSFSGQAAHRIGVAFHFECIRYQAGNGLRLGIIGKHVTVAPTRYGDREQCVTVRDIQGAEFGLDVIVAGFGAFFQRVGELVITGADQCLGTGHIIGRAFIANEVLPGDFLVNQGIAVVFLAVGRRLQRHRALGDGQLAGNIRDIVVALSFFTRRRDRILAHIGTVFAAGGVADQIRLILILETGNLSGQHGISFAVNLGLLIRRYGSRRRRNGQDCCIIGYVVVALYSFAARGDDILAHLLRFRISAADVNIQYLIGIIPLQAIHSPGQFRIRLAIYLSLFLRGNRHICPGNGQVGGFIGYCVIQRVAAHDGCCDAVIVDILAGGTAQPVENRSVIIRIRDAADNSAGLVVILQADHFCRQFGILFAIFLGLGFRLDGQLRRGNCQITGLEFHLIVTLGGIANRRDDVITYIVAFLTADGRHGNSVLGFVVLQAVHGPGQFRIVCAVHLALGFRGNSHFRLVDGQVLRHIDHIVVALFRIACRRYGVLTDSLAFLGAANAYGQQALLVFMLQAAYAPGVFRIRFAILLGLLVRGYGRSRPGDGQLIGVKDHVIVALHLIAGRRNGIFADILTSRTAHAHGQHVLRIAVGQAVHGPGQFRISRAIHLGLGFRIDGCRRLGNGQVLRDISDIVVALLRFAARRDSVGSDIFTGCAIDSNGQDALRIAVGQAVHGPGQFRISRAIHLGLGFRGDSRLCLGNGQVLRGINYIVVALHRFAAGRDGVCSDIFAFRTADINSQYILLITIRQAFNSPGQFRISRAIHLRLGFRSDSCCRLINGQLTGLISYFIVALFGLAVGSDDISAFGYIFTFSAADSHRQLILAFAVLQAFHGPGQFRIFSPVGLFLILRGNRHRCRLDGQRAIRCANRELIGHVIAFFIRYHRGTGHIHRIITRVGSFRCSSHAADGVGMSVDREGFGDHTAYGLLGSVISILSTLARHRDFELRFTVLDRQAAGIRLDCVVAFFHAFVQRVGERVGTAAHQQLAAGHIVGCAFIGREAVAGHGHITIGQRAAVIFLLSAAGGQSDTAFVNGQHAGHVTHIIVALHRFAVRSDGILCHVIAFRAADVNIQQVPAVVQLQAGHVPGQRRIRIAVGLALVFSSYDQLGLCDLQGTVNILDFVVALHVGTGRADAVGSDILAIFGYFIAFFIRNDGTTHCIGDNALCISVLQVGYNRCEGGIAFAVFFIRAVHGDGRRRPVDYQVAGRIGHAVVALQRVSGRSDDVSLYVLTLSPADGHCQQFLGFIIHQAVCCPGQFRISVAISLCLVLRGYNHALRVDRKDALSGGNIVVRVAAQVDVDVICADIFVIRAAQRIVQAFAGHQSAYFRIQGRISYAVGLALVLCRHAGSLRVDLQGAFDRADTVVFSLGVRIQRIAEGVSGFTCTNLRSGHIVDRTFTGHESIAGYGHSVVRQRRAVIGLFRICTRQRYFAGAYGQDAFVRRIDVVRV